MSLTHVTQEPFEAFILANNEEISIDCFVDELTMQYHVKFDENLKWKRIDRNGSGALYVLLSKTGNPILELIQIGTSLPRRNNSHTLEEPTSKYFCADSPSNSPDSQEYAEFRNFHESLKRLASKSYQKRLFN